MAISRREFAQFTTVSAMAVSALPAQPARRTVQDVIDQIEQNLGAPWQVETIDGLKAGDASTVVTGIATTAMATMDVLNRAMRDKTNLIVTAEPVFFARTDAQSPAAAASGRGAAGVAADDPVLAAKKEFIRKNGLAVFRFSDNWRARKPDPFIAGMVQAMGWTGHQSKSDPARCDIPEIGIGALADRLAARLQARAGIRVVGDPQSRVRRIALLPGVSALAASVKALPECDLIIAGEVREWESVEYAQDTVASGQKKGLIMLGRILSEEPGMNACAEWLTKLLKDVPVRHVPTGDPYWRPV